MSGAASSTGGVIVCRRRPASTFVFETFILITIDKEAL